MILFRGLFRVPRILVSSQIEFASKCFVTKSACVEFSRLNGENKTRREPSFAFICFCIDACVKWVNKILECVVKCVKCVIKKRRMSCKYCFYTTSVAGSRFYHQENLQRNGKRTVNIKIGARSNTNVSHQ